MTQVAGDGLDLRAAGTSTRGRAPDKGVGDRLTCITSARNSLCRIRDRGPVVVLVRLFLGAFETPGITSQRRYCRKNTIIACVDDDFLLAHERHVQGTGHHLLHQSRVISAYVVVFEYGHKRAECVLVVDGTVLSKLIRDRRTGNKSNRAKRSVQIPSTRRAARKGSISNSLLAFEDPTRGVGGCA
jgi:hypothetical protein